MNDKINDQGTTKLGNAHKEESRAGPVFWAGLIGGSFIASGGFIALGLNFGSPPVSILVICSGLSIVLGAFGSLAFLELKLQGVTVAGVAAICLVLFYFVTNNIQKSAIKIDITGIERGATVSMFSSGDRQIFGALRGKSYQFVAFTNDLDSKLLSLSIEIAAIPDVSKETTILFECIPRSAIDRYMGSGETLQWRVNMDDRKLETRDSNPVLIARDSSCRKGGDKISYWRWPSLISTAYAQVPTTTDIALSLRDLSSESTALRRDARKALAAQGVDGVKPIMQQWANEKDSYRVKLGSAVALAEMLREQKADRRAVGAQLSDADLKLVAKSLSDEDRTVRVYASEFLTDLGDKRLASIVLDQLPTANEAGQDNLALVLESVAPELSSAEREKLRTELARLRADSSIKLSPRRQEKLEAAVNQPQPTDG